MFGLANPVRILKSCFLWLRIRLLFHEFLEVETSQMSAETVQTMENFVSGNVMRLARKYSLHGQQYLAEEGSLTFSEWILLVWLERLTEPSESELSTILNKDVADIFTLAGSLAERGLINHLETAGEVFYSLTEAGDQKFEQLLPKMQLRQDNLVSNLDPDELNLFTDILMRLEATVDQQLGALEGSGSVG